MFDNLEEIEKEYEELTKKISDPAEIADQENWKKMMKKQSDLEPIVNKYREYKKAEADLEEAKSLAKDQKVKKHAAETIQEAKDR